MALAQATEKVEQKLPPQYAKYAKVFDEPKGGELPPRQPFDHGIELKETFILKVAKSYPMNPKETEACTVSNKTVPMLYTFGMIGEYWQNH